MQAQNVATMHLVICAITNATGRWIDSPDKVLKTLGEGSEKRNLMQTEIDAACEKVIPTFCAMCGPGLGCGIYTYVQNGRFTSSLACTCQ